MSNLCEWYLTHISPGISVQFFPLPWGFFSRFFCNPLADCIVLLNKYYYKGYVMTHIKTNMLVVCSKNWVNGNALLAYKGTIGRVISFDLSNGTVTVRMLKVSVYSGLFINVDILTPPIQTSFFNN